MKSDPVIPGLCKTCRHWKDKDDDGFELDDNITAPVDPDTWEPMVLPFEVRQCKHPKLLFCERPLEDNGFAVADGSTYRAYFYTAEKHGCVLWEALP